MVMEIENHWLEPRQEVIETPFVGGELNTKYVVIHTQGRHRAIPEAISDWTEYEDAKESMHLLVRKDGKYAQFAGFKTKVWHCGASYYQGHHGLNNWSIGICLENYDGFEFPDTQLNALEIILRLIISAYNIRDIVGHDEVSMDQLDPGSGFPMERYRPLVRYGNADAHGRYVVTAPADINLNVRGGPDVQFDIIDKLSPGYGVKVIRRNNFGDWCQIVYEHKGDRDTRHGWVHESFLKRL